MKKQTRIIVVIILLALVVLVAVVVRLNRPQPQMVAMGEPVDIVVDFYDTWLEQLQAEDTNPYESGLVTSEFLSRDLQKKLKDGRKESEEDIDPVLCQSTTDIKIATRRVSEGEDRVQILVTARDKSLTGQAIITLFALNDGWYIDDITCAPGEFDEPREFTFEREGYVLKGALLESLDPEQLYLIFEENNEPGYSAPLFFNDESVCMDLKGTEATCSVDQFTEVTKVYVKGDMTERGVDVKHVQMVKE